MAHLSLSLLGPFQVTLEGQPVTGFKSDKVRALLAYLAVEADRPHRREGLAGLLWPDWPDREALSNLRYTLSNLRRVIGDRQAEPPFLLITRDTLQFNPASDSWLDVTAFTAMVEVNRAHPSATDRLQQAVALYQGSFLEGFSISDSPAFEEWVLLTRERLARQVSSALHHLADIYEQRGEYEPAQAWARRQIELEPWDEAAYQQLMRMLALTGQRGAALAQYETCRRMLAEKLGVEPARETMWLYEQIRDGLLSRGAEERRGKGEFVAAPPAFLTSAPLHPSTSAPFVARERELAQLDGMLELALASQGRVAFVTGEAGSGKTALLQAFARRAQDAHADLVAAGGNCNAYTGIGDPYLPFREILELLTGDIEARWAAGAMTREHAQRLWQTLPLAAQALVEAGPDLIDTFLPRVALLERAAACTQSSDRPDWLFQLHELLERKPMDPGARGPQQSDLFEQYTHVLSTLAQHRPLLLTVDDLQWADLGSISLLFHLGRHLAGSRILILGAYRPEEVAIGRDGERHALEPVVNEFQRGFGNITVNVDRAEGRSFVEAFLDSEPNRLGGAFRDMLYRQTCGHPLFAVELLRGLQERGDLVRDPEGRWVEGPALSWETLPARVEAVIAERIDRLARPLRAALRVASVEGELFTAEVVAWVRATDERELLGCLSGELDRRHRLIRAQSIVRVGGQLLSRYQFRHILFQKYLYNSLDEIERVHLHEQVGTALEALYGSREQVKAIAVQLARHFQKARIAEKAIHYLHQAGDEALRLSAHEEAIAHLTEGLALLERLPDGPERTEQELDLQMALGTAVIAVKGYGAPELERAHARAQELCWQLEDLPRLSLVLTRLWTYYYIQGRLQTAHDLTEGLLAQVRDAQEPIPLLELHHLAMGITLLWLGDLAAARLYMERALELHDPQQRDLALSIYACDSHVLSLAHIALLLWTLGYPDQALHRVEAALSEARELNHPFSRAFALIHMARVHYLRREYRAACDYAAAAVALSDEYGLAQYQAAGHMLHGGTRTQPTAADIAELEEGLAYTLNLGREVAPPSFLALLAEVHARLGGHEKSLSVVSEALAAANKTEERWYESELHRLRGELLLAQGDAGEAETSFQTALDMARRQGARSFELRAAVSLARLWRGQGEEAQARELLADIYGWFTEGFDTIDLIEARTLLEELS